MPTPEPDKVFDELLVMQYKAGDKKAVELLIKRWNKRIVMYVFRNTQSMEASKDIAQEVWMIALKNLNQLKDNLKIGSWLLSIAHHKSVDWIRQHQKERNLSSTTEVTGDKEIKDHSDQLSSMRMAMQELSEAHRNILSLYYLEGFTIAEIAHILQVSKGTIKSRLFYARESLKKKVKNNNHE